MPGLNQKFTKNVPLPSEGFFYDSDSPLKDGVAEIKYPTAAEEDILTDQTLRNKGRTLDEFVRAIVEEPVDVDTLLSGDKSMIVIAGRMLAYGENYSFKARSQETGETEKVTVDLSEVDFEQPDFDELEPGKQEFEFSLPGMSGVTVVWRLMTHGMEVKMQDELREQKSKNQVTTRLTHHIQEVRAEDETLTQDGEIRFFVKNQMLARDSQALRQQIAETTPGVDLTFEFENSLGNTEELPIQLTTEFFFPSQMTT